ncbi:MAG: hypothetical protein OXC07_12900 [Kistimonas sp.]|nr:hypothetical protein [Kistimonas sp.]
MFSFRGYSRQLFSFMVFAPVTGYRLPVTGYRLSVICSSSLSLPRI